MQIGNLVTLVQFESCVELFFIFLLVGANVCIVSADRLPLQRLPSVHWPRRNRKQSGQNNSCGENVHRLRELLDDVAPDESDYAEQADDEFVELLGAGLAHVVDVSWKRP